MSKTCYDETKTPALLTKALLTKKHFAERLDISPWFVDDMIARDIVRSVALGGRRLILASEVERIIKDALEGRGPLSKGHRRCEAAIAWLRSEEARQFRAKQAEERQTKKAASGK